MPFAVGDIRVAARGEWLADRILATGSLVLRKLGGTRAGEMAVRRFLSSPYVSVASITEALAARTAEQCAGRRVVAIQDTSEINFAGASKRRRGFGPGGNGRDPGFFIHPVIAVDAADEAIIGVVGAAIWTRAEGRVAARRSRPIEDKESIRWLDGCTTAASVLETAASLTMIADRESDIYELFARRPARLDLIVRAAQDRRLADDSQLFEALVDAPTLARKTVRVAPRGPGDKGRVAEVSLHAGTVRIARPAHIVAGAAPDDIELTLVEACEIDPPNPKDALCWRLLTSHTVESAEQAAEIVDLYRLRWRIEQTFRALKSDGLRLDDTQLTEPERLFNLSAMALAAAVRTIQLVDARDGSSRPANDVVDPALTPALARISRSLEGKTERQKNPHPPQSLAFVAWITARLGGWNCYGKPPGPKTMRDGWHRLAPMLAGYLMATGEADV
jgi:hypothetical protein